MIGKICTAITPYYDAVAKKRCFKSRPVLIVAKADNDDYVALPISKVSRRENVDRVYDIEVDPAKYPASSLTQLSYVRTHKQITVHISEIVRTVSDLRSAYQDLYIDILSKREQFSNAITQQALDL